MSWIVKVAKLLSPDLVSQAKSSKSVQILTICFSHYCELACWSLDKAHIKYVEHAYAPGQHILPALSLRVGGAKPNFAKTSHMNKVTTGETKPIDEKKAAAIDRKARATTVPAAVFPDGSVVCDSWEIASKSGLPEVEPSLKKMLDEDLGPLARQAAYMHILKPQNDNIFQQLFTENKHWIWRFFWWAYFGKYLKNHMIKFMKPFDAVANKECITKLDNTIDKLNTLVANRKTPYLGGDSIGIADIAVASLLGPLVTPPLYYQGRFTHIFDKLEKQDPAVHADAERYRNTVVGEYVMNLYKNHRMG